MSIEIDYKGAKEQRLAVLTLNNPKSLNALTEQMVCEIGDFLVNVQDDDSIAAVLFCGNDRALCAGGDIKGLYHTIKDTQDVQNTPEAFSFFVQEYRLNHLMHTYKKPLIAWGSGIVMGGGLGLFMSCSHRIVTETTLMAMPEVSIGLFPDAGGSYFLNRLGKVGLFFGLTGARWQAADAWAYGMATAVLPSEGLPTLIDTLMQAESLDAFSLNKIISDLHTDVLSSSAIARHYNDIQRLMNAGDLMAVDKALRSYAPPDDFMGQAIDTYKAGSPTTKALTWELFQKAYGLSLKQVLQLELNTAISCCQNGEFFEGVRALLIDKDKSPNWQYTLDTLPAGHLDSFFEPKYQKDGTLIAI